MKKIGTTILFNIAFLIILVGQASDAPIQFWINSGIGQAQSEAFDRSGLVGGMGFYLKAKHHLFSTQVNQFWELPKDGLVRSEINEMKLQYGWIKAKNNKAIFIAAGISSNTYDYYVSIPNRENRPAYTKKEVITATSFVLESGINWRLYKHIGLGFTAMGSLNNTALTGGYRINVLFGLFE